MGKLPTQRGSDWPRLWSGLGSGLGFRLARALPENVGLRQVEGRPPARSPPIFRDRALLRMCSSRARRTPPRADFAAERSAAWLRRLGLNGLLVTICPCLSSRVPVLGWLKRETKRTHHHAEPPKTRQTHMAQVMAESSRAFSLTLAFLALARKCALRVPK